MNKRKRALGIALIGLLLSHDRNTFAAATITASFGTAPTGPSQSFTINLVMSGSAANISGFNFRFYYDDTQITLNNSVTDNTGQPGAGVDYTVGPVTAGSNGGNTNKFRNILMATNSDLVSPTNLAQLNLSTTPGFNVNTPIAYPNFQITDVGVNDGQYDSSFVNIAHSFVTGVPGLPVKMSKLRLD